MKALVLGGNGFIGSHLVDKLLDANHSVSVFDRMPEKFRPPLSGVNYHLASLNDVPALAEAIEGIDVVFNLISTTVPSTSNKDPIYDVESNLISSLQLLNLIKDSSVSKLVYLSSGGTVYGIPERSPIPESHPLKPICSYAVVKLAVENYLQMYDHLYGVKSVVLRASNPYGERQGHTGVQGVIGTFMNKVSANEKIDIWGDGNIVRDFIYVGDLANLCVQAGTSEVVGTYNAGSGTGHSINEIINMLSMVSGKNIQKKYHPSRMFDIPTVILDISKATQAFSWEPECELLEGIRLSWEWVNNYYISNIR